MTDPTAHRTARRPTPLYTRVVSGASSAAGVSLSEVLGALSYALDLTEGQPPGHTVRSCLIGMRIADSLDLSPADRSALYYALLLKDAGCSSNAARMAAVFGADDRFIKPRMKVVDWHDRLRLAVNTARNAGAGRSIFARVRHFVAVARTKNLTRDLIAVRCDRGAGIARRLGFPEATASAIQSLDEHWCGLGYAEGLAGDSIPLLARICNIAQTVDAFLASGGPDAALRVVRRRRGTWFDPQLAAIVLSWRKDSTWWRTIRRDDAAALVLTAEPADHVERADDARLDEVALAFADIIDAKSPYTYRHSARVAGYARAIAGALGIDETEQRRIYRAGLLDDVGKLGVSSRILDKNGSLTPEEWAEVRRHPDNTFAILSRVTAFASFAWTAAIHHEKLDGSGYSWGLEGSRIDQSARLLAVADIYDALTSDRPYRPGLSPADAVRILEKDAGTKLCARSIDAVRELTRAGEWRV